MTSTDPSTEVPMATPSPEAVRGVKITILNAKNLATAFKSDISALRSEAGQLRELVRRQAREAERLAAERQAALHDRERLRDALDAMKGLTVLEITQRVTDLEQAERSLKIVLDNLAAEKTRLEAEIVSARDRLSLESLGLFDFEHPAEDSAELAEELMGVRADIKQANRIGAGAITAIQNFTFNNSSAKGKTFVNQMSRIMLRAYNAEAENAVKTVKAGNLEAATKRLTAAKDQIAKQGTMISLAVTDSYHRLRLRELELAARHLQAVAAEKELERERRAELREQKALEAEIKRAREKLEKELTHYSNSIQRLRDAGDESGARALEEELHRIEAEIEQVDYRAANIRAGYVYVISNIGAFGEGVVKIGMTRRLDPMDRVRELGDASVPFTFDVHALFFSDDAIGIEAMLHREFAQQRLNKVNLRKEFFRVAPEAVLTALQEHNVAVLEFRTHPDAEDFRASWPELATEISE